MLTFIINDHYLHPLELLCLGTHPVQFHLPASYLYSDHSQHTYIGIILRKSTVV